MDKTQYHPTPAATYHRREKDMQYNRSQVMRRAWNTYHDARRHGMWISFSDCLRKAWAAVKTAVRNAAIVAAAKAAAGITETIDTWYGWKEAGREVLHGSKAVFQVVLEKVSQPGKVYTASYFTLSQTTAEEQPPKAA